MARVKVKAIKDGVWHSPQGPVPVDAARRQHFADQIKKMRGAGLNIPVCWGHNVSAVPNHAEQTYLAARFNAGYIEDANAIGEDLFLDVNAPGLEHKDGHLVSVAKLPDTQLPVTTAIKEVSLGLAKKFIDGKKVEWNDCITHLAVTPHPVVGGQEGFQQLGLVEEFTTIVIDPQNLEHEMPIETPAKADESVKEESKEKEEKKPDESKKPKEDKSSYSFDSLLTDLHELGIALPDDTKPDESGWERLYVAVHALKNKGGLSQSVVEERPEHLMMSLIADLEKTNPAAAKALKDEQAKSARYEREDRERRWKACQDKLQTLCLPQSVIELRFLSLQQQNLSLDTLDEPTLAKVESDLALAESMWGPELTRLAQQLSLGTEAENPLAALHKKAQEDATKHMDDMIRMAGAKVPEANGVKK